MSRRGLTIFLLIESRLRTLLNNGIIEGEKISPNTAGYGLGLTISNKIAQNLSD